MVDDSFDLDFPIQVILTPQNDELDPNDQRWVAQLSDLYDRLRDDLGTLEVVRTPVPGTKGSIETVIVALGSSGTIYAALEAFKAWL